jgi:hypothetical protein
MTGNNMMVQIMVFCQWELDSSRAVEKYCLRREREREIKRARV